MLICAVAVTPIVFASQVTGLWSAVLLVSLAASAHQGWSANLFTLVSDMFPRRAVGSVVGFGGMAGAIGGMCLTLVVGEILQRTGSYVGVFIIAGSMYLIGLLVIQLLVPRLDPGPHRLRIRMSRLQVVQDVAASGVVAVIRMKDPSKLKASPTR
jgi:ACS family hexuronate transporter-like MFS transporter